MNGTVETNSAKIVLLKDINAEIGEEKESRTRRKKAETAFKQLREERLNPQMRLF